MRFRFALFALPVAGVLVLAAGCGSSSSASPPIPSTASGTTTPSTATATGPSTSSAGPSGDSNQLALAMKVPPGADGEKFSACMRTHGVPNFPDPNGQGVIQITGGTGRALDPGSPKFSLAQETCRKLLPNGGQATPSEVAAAQRKLLAYSACMRKHGVPDYPDPSFHGNTVQLEINGGDSNSPKFRSAQQACKADLPGKAGGVLTQHAGPK